MSPRLLTRFALPMCLALGLAGCHGINLNGAGSSTASSSAQGVIGQADFTDGQANMGSSQPAADTLDQPAGKPGAASGGPFYLPDQGNNRVLGFDSIPTGVGASADFVLGQNSFTSYGSAVGDNAFNAPRDAWVYNGNLYVADTGNNRVLVWTSLPSDSNPTTADKVVGQASLTSSASGQTQSTLDGPGAIFATNNKLFVADTQNNRVLIYNLPLSQYGQNAAVVLGQDSFTANGHATATNRLYHPEGIWSDGTRLVIADTGNNRVLIYNAIPSSGHANPDASVVVGQPDFTSNGFGTSKNTLNQPAGVFVSGGKLYVADTGNNRVMVYNFPTANQPDADKVLGQPDFTTNTTGSPSDHSLDQPTGVAVISNNVYVSDHGNNRVLVFKTP